MSRKNVFSQKGGEPKVKRMLVIVPETVYKALRHQSVEVGLNMSEIVTQALRKHLGIKEGGDAPKK